RDLREGGRSHYRRDRGMLRPSQPAWLRTIALLPRAHLRRGDECEGLWSRFRELASDSRPRFFPTYCLSFSRFDFRNPSFNLGGPCSFDTCVLAFVQAGN